MSVRSALNPVSKKQFMWGVVNRYSNNLEATHWSRRDARLDAQNMNFTYGYNKASVVRLDYTPVFAAR